MFASKKVHSQDALLLSLNFTTFLYTFKVLINLAIYMRRNNNSNVYFVVCIDLGILK